MFVHSNFKTKKWTTPQSKIIIGRASSPKHQGSIWGLSNVAQKRHPLAVGEIGQNDTLTVRTFLVPWIYFIE
jgi:hypothetical protein